MNNLCNPLDNYTTVAHSVSTQRFEYAHNNTSCHDMSQLIVEPLNNNARRHDTTNRHEAQHNETTRHATLGHAMRDQCDVTWDYSDT